MDFYRVFLWDHITQGKKLLKTFYPPRHKQGPGRHDIPDRDGVIYCSISPVSAIAEILQGFRGTEISDKVFLRPDGKSRALIHIALDDNISVLNLDNPENLLKYNLKPSRIATFNRASTQNISRLLFDEGENGFTWWSVLEASWINATLFESRIQNHLKIIGKVKTLNTKQPEVIEAAKVLKIKIVK